MINRVADKIGSGGVWLAALSCTACFPALGSLASAIGLSFLSGFEGISITILLPLFTVIALASNLFSWYKHRLSIRGLMSISGPIMVLLALYPLWFYGWSETLFYSGISLMIAISVFDLLKPVSESACRI